MSNLIYPNLFLFLYDLRESLGENPEDLAKNQRIFAAKFLESPKSLRQSLFDSDTAFESDYLELLPKKPKKIERFPDSDKPFKGYYYPVRLNDTYGLLVGCSFAEDTTGHLTSCLADFKAKIEEKLKGQQATIGQSWLILAHLDNSNSNPEDIAKNCCQALNLGFNWKEDLQGQGRFLGGNLFELWQYQLLMHESIQENTPAPTLEQIQQNHHLIIALYPNAATAKQAAEEFNKSWLRLFCYRNKILWAYAQSRYLKQRLEENFTKIKKVSTLDLQKENLKQLRQTVIDAQNTLSNYTIDLNNFDYQIRTIEVNLLNYNRRLTTIQKRLSEIQVEAGNESLKTFMPVGFFSWLQASAASLPVPNDNQFLLTQFNNWKHPCDLKFLENFRDEAAKKYLLQLQKDYENLSSGLPLLQDLINSIRTITEIDQAQRDRTFQNTVAIVGVGLAVGSFVVSLEKLGENKDDPVRLFLDKSVPVPKFWLEPAIPLVYGLGLGIVAAALTWLVIRFWSRIASLGRKARSR